MKLLICVCLVSFFSLGYSASVPMTKCASKDAKCMISSSQAVLPLFAQGIPELGVETLDPAHFTKPIDASVSGLKLIITDLVIKGTKNCIVKKMDRDVANSKLSGSLLCDVIGDGNYKMDGKLLIIPVRGEGKLHFELNKILISINGDIGEKIKNGKKYWDVKRFSHAFELKGKSDVKFENLFTESDVLGRAASQVIESSGNDIVNEVGPPVIKVIVKKVVENIRKFFHHVPADELALD